MLTVMKIAVESNLAKADQNYLRRKLEEFNEPYAGEPNTEEFGLTIRDDNGEIVAGVVASCVYEWLHINVIWVEESLRGQGYGDALIQAAEAEGRKRGRRHAMLHTFSFQARPFYEKHGYQLSGELPNFPEGHSQYKMFKSLIHD